MLYERLRHAKRNSLLSESQLAELSQLQASVSRESSVAERMETLMGGIRALGHIPRLSRSRPHPDEKARTLNAEHALRNRLWNAKSRRLLNESQLAELAAMPTSREVVRATRMDILMAEIRALGHIPRVTKGLGNEYALDFRWRYAKANGQLSESQLAELAEIARSSDEPGRKRARMLGD